MGMTDVTHLGWFDIALISNIPGWVYLAPATVEEYLAMQRWAMAQTAYAVAIRIPGGAVVHSDEPVQEDYSELNKFLTVRQGSGVAIIGAGSMLGVAEQAADILARRGKSVTVINPRYLSGLDTELLDELRKDHQQVITLEDGVIDGGFGEKVARYYGPTDMKVNCLGVEKKFLDRYSPKELLAASGLTAEAVAGLVK